jgi:hypothetical protein
MTRRHGARRALDVGPLDPVGTTAALSPPIASSLGPVHRLVRGQRDSTFTPRLQTWRPSQCTPQAPKSLTSCKAHRV